MSQNKPTLDDCVSQRTLDGIEFANIVTGRLRMPPRNDWFAPPLVVHEAPVDVLDCITVVARTPTGEVIVVDPSNFDARTIEKAAVWDLRAEATCELNDALACVGVKPDEVTHVLITHGHFDHFSGAGDGVSIHFPAAEHFVPELDWTAENGPTSEDLREILAPVAEAGLLRPVSGELAVTDDVDYVPAPGDSAGHHVVRVGGMWCLGDLVHFASEVEHLDWGPIHVSKELAERSRRDIFQRLAGDHVVFAHSEFPGWGSIQAEGDGWRYIHDFTTRTE